ncbi:MAG: carboxypeptidase-like regulatory domain-containing protein [Planctomycetota bacterium]
MSGTEKILAAFIIIAVLGAGSYLVSIFMDDASSELKNSGQDVELDVETDDTTQARRKRRSLRNPTEIVDTGPLIPQKPAKIVIASAKTIIGRVTAIAESAVFDDSTLESKSDPKPDMPASDLNADLAEPVVVGVEGAKINCRLYFPDAEQNYGTVSKFKTKDDSGPEGNFSLDVPGHGSYFITVSHPNYSPVIVEKVKAGAELEIKLTKGAMLVGVVTSKGNGKPVANATMKLWKNGTSWSKTVKSNDEGQYRFEGIYPETLYLSIDHDSYVPILDEEIIIALDGKNEKDIILDEGKTIRGTIKDPREQFVANATIKIGKKKGFSNELGEFRVSGLATSQHYTEVVAEGFLTFNQTVNLSGSRDEAVLEVALSEGGIIEGDVMSDTGDLLKDVEIKIFQTWGGNHMWDTGNTRFSAKTDEDGHFKITGFSKSTWNGYAVRAQHKDYADTYSDQIKIKDIKKPERIRLIMGAGGTISGRVTNRDEQAIAGAKLSLNPNNVYEWNSNGNSSLRTTISDKDGRYEFTSLGPKTYRISLIAPGYASQYKSGFKIQGALILDKQDFTLEGGEPIVGTVKTEDGEGIPKVNISIWSKKSYARAVTDENGEYTITNVGDGPFTATASTKGYSHERKKDIYPDEGKIDFELKTNGYVWGVVTDKASKKPVRRYRVELQAPDEKRGGNNWRTKASTWINSPDGKFKLYTKDGNYKIIVRSKGHILYEKQGININVDAEPEEMKIILVPGGAVEGWVKDGQGEPMQQVAIYVRNMDKPDDPTFSRKGNTERDGYFYLDSLEAGSYEFAFYQHGRMPLVIKSYVNVQGGELRLIDVGLSLPSIVTIVVQDENEKPIRSVNASIEALGSNPILMSHHRWDKTRGSLYKPGYRRGQWMGSKGYVTLRDLAPGLYRLTVRRGGYETWSEEFLVRSGNNMEVMATIIKKKKKKRTKTRTTSTR